MRELKNLTPFVLKKHGYNPILKPIEAKKSFYVSKVRSNYELRIYRSVWDKATGYKFKNIAYISDCIISFQNQLNFLKNLNYLIIDCLRIQKHSHFNLESDRSDKKLNLKSILTNLHVDLDYKTKENSTQKCRSMYDGLKISF